MTEKVELSDLLLHFFFKCISWFALPSLLQLCGGRSAEFTSGHRLSSHWGLCFQAEEAGSARVATKLCSAVLWGGEKGNEQLSRSKDLYLFFFFFYRKWMLDGGHAALRVSWLRVLSGANGL